MTELELALHQQQLGRQQQQQDIEHVNRGLGGVMGVLQGASQRNIAEAEKRRPVASPVQKFLNMALEGKMTPRQAARAYQLQKNGMIPQDLFDADPNTPGIQAPSQDAQGGFAGGAAPGMAGAPGLQPQGGAPVQGPVNAPYVPQSQGGLATPAQYSPNPAVYEAVPVDVPQQAAMPAHQWTVRDVTDLEQATGALGKMASPQRDFMGELEMRLAAQRALQNDRQDFTGGENQKTRESKEGMHAERMKLQKQKLDAFITKADADRDAAMQRVLAQLKQSDINSLRATNTKEDLKLADMYQEAESNIRNAIVKLETSKRALYEDPSMAVEIQEAQAELAQAIEKKNNLTKQIEARLKVKPSSDNISQTTIKTSPAPAAVKTADDFLKRRQKK